MPNRVHFEGKGRPAMVDVSAKAAVKHSIAGLVMLPEKSGGQSGNWAR